MAAAAHTPRPRGWLCSALASASLACMTASMALFGAVLGGLVSRSYEPLMLVCTFLSAYFSLFTLVVPSSDIPSTRQTTTTPVPFRLPLHQVAPLITFAIIVWLYFVPFRLAFPINQLCQGRCHQHIRWGENALTRGLDQLIGPIDLADHQWRDFRSQLPLLIFVACAHLLFGRLLLHSSQSQQLVITATGSVLFVVLLHGARAVILFIFVAVNFSITRTNEPSRTACAGVWIIGAIILLGKEVYPWLVYSNSAGGWYWPASLLDWQILSWRGPANLLALRLISFTVDRYRSQCEHRVSATSSTCSLTEYELQLYLIYVFYPPLYLAGPLISYNDFALQWLKRHPFWSAKEESPSKDRIDQLQRQAAAPDPVACSALYVLRLLGALLLLEVLGRAFHGFALSRSGAYRRLNSMQLCVFAYWLLKLIWLKFLVIWRFFRLWAAIDGIQTVENLPQCISRQYSLSAFWRTWHASFNRWLLLYIYIPLGGRAWRWRNLSIVFLFVACWHDVNFKLLAWGLLLPLFFIPELLAEKLCGQLKLQCSPTLHRHFCALGGACNILMLVAANVIGFGIDADGAQAAAHKLRSIEGGWTLSIAFCTLFVGVHLDLEVIARYGSSFHVETHRAA